MHQVEGLGVPVFDFRPVAVLAKFGMKVLALAGQPRQFPSHFRGQRGIMHPLPAHKLKIAAVPGAESGFVLLGLVQPFFHLRIGNQQVANGAKVVI